MHEAREPESKASRRPSRQAKKQPFPEKLVHIRGAWYRLDIEKREFQNIDDPDDRVSFFYGDPLVEEDGKWHFTGNENGWLVIAAYRLNDDPDLTLQEAFHGCERDGHLMIFDEEKDIDWNEHFILFPKRCKICGLRDYRVERVTKGYRARLATPD